VVTTLIVTNDFPPRVGGIESFVADVVEMLGRDVVVYTSSSPGSAAADRALDIEVIRGGPVLLPTPAATRRAVHILQRSGASRVLFGAAAPLGLMASSLRRAGAERIVALSHGHETWWATLPGSRSLLRRIGDAVDAFGTISDFTTDQIAPALTPSARARLVRLPPPVDLDLFRPEPPVSTGRRRVVSVGRLVQQKGFDTLLEAWSRVLLHWPSTTPPPELVIIGDGPRRRRLEAMGRGLHLDSTVRLLGALPRGAVVAQLQAAQVFALPVRTRRAGLNPEGLGLAAIEAAACGLPVIVGRSGGAPETVQDGRTGYVVDPENVDELAERISFLLSSPEVASAMGAHGRTYVSTKFGFDSVGRSLRQALDLS
jgi:phosphatidylinositol alpha-1,6-mannosyltransferase